MRLSAPAPSLYDTAPCNAASARLPSFGGFQQFSYSTSSATASAVTAAQSWSVANLSAPHQRGSSQHELVPSAAQPAAIQRAGNAPTWCYSPAEPALKEPLGDVLKRAGKRALGGGVPGAAAMGVQVLSLMWLRTTVNYQYRNGGSMTNAFQTLYKDGGIRRFYRGVGPALVQGPMSRFGDTAANAGTLALLDSYDSTKTLPVAAKTTFASASAAGFRILLMPVDAMKTTLQVEGATGLTVLKDKMKIGGPRVLYHGALAASAATFVGHYPWFFVYNELNEHLPQYDELPKRLLRSAVIGFAASATSDTCSNSIRVIKTTKQTHKEAITYPQALQEVLAKDGMIGLFGRGLKTKILANGLQGMLFTVLWRLGQDAWNKDEK